MSNSDTLKGNWKQLKGSIRSHWAELTEDEVEGVKGDWQNLVGKIQEKYGVARDKAEEQASSFLKQAKDKLNSKA